MDQYDHKAIEKKWQQRWLESGIFNMDESSTKPKFYSLIEFPFPSGEGMHVGHLRSNTAMDIISRKRRAEGFNVLYPIGWDAFGLPTENYALKTGVKPADATKTNTDNFRRQLQSAGFSFDWSREINTTDPTYYKWTQWIFLQFLKHGLAYKAKTLVNWCPKDKTVLANEEVIQGVCERCGTPVEKREKEQWMMAITKYAERLDKDLDTVDYPERVKIQQRNWIGKSEGSEISFELSFTKKSSDKSGHITVFTTRADTLFGATYLVLSPEHPWVTLATDGNHDVLVNKDEVKAYVEAAKKKTEIERTNDEKEKTGVELKGLKAIHPLTKEELPIFVADYVLAQYGTGAIMAVPAHDKRDFDFAKKYNMPIVQVIAPEMGIKRPNEERRDGGCAIVFDPKNQKYAVGKQDNGNLRLLSGGVDAHESIEQGILREVEEESGLHNFKHVETIGTAITHYYNTLKQVNRYAYATCLLVILENTETKDVHLESHEKFSLAWATANEIKENWSQNNEEHDNDHWLYFLKPAVARAIELGFDTTSNTSEYKNDPFTGEGILINSGDFSGMESNEAKKKITEAVDGKMVTTFKLRDWVFSRQRYWGEPIPVVHCEKCGIVPVPEDQLPLLLPEVENIQPTDTGESPLAVIYDWVNTTCPKCGGPAKRETDTMPQWAGSSWYFLRYIDPKNDQAFAAPAKLKKWMPVDWYNGGMEHTTLHLLYSRFWNKFLFDIGEVPTSEPYAKRTSHGLILAEGGEKMSKSKGNSVIPDKIIEQVGADTLRLYEMFMGPFEQAVSWSTDGIVGPRRFIERVWNLSKKVGDRESDKKLVVAVNTGIEKISQDIEHMKFNTAVSSLMVLSNQFEKAKTVGKKEWQIFLQLFAPFAPHVAEELWEKLGHTQSISLERWPKARKDIQADAEHATIIIQINGKMRDSVDISKEEANDQKRIEEIALERPAIQKWLEGKTIQKIITVAGRLVNIVVQ